MSRAIALCLGRAALTLGLAWSCGAGQAAEPTYDVVIRNGRLLDGEGNPWVRADVAIRDGRFVKIGQIEIGRAHV